MELETLGPFKIGRVLGRGGMGAVYEGINETDNSAVAIKVLPDPTEEDAEVRVRFETEIETLKRLYHPNIVRLSGFGAEQGLLYYVMELVDGPSLQQELRKKRLFQWDEVAKIGLEICQALRHAHDRGVVHRDIKPANILLDKEGNVKLSDFGIARFFGSQQITDTHSVIGTLEYMSPEQALANPISASTDLYSLGCVLYVLLTGKPPFPARSLPELLRKHKTAAPALIRSVRFDVPDELGYIIFDMLQIRPEDRPRNAFLVTKRLQSLMQALIGDPAEVKVLPMSPETPRQSHEPLPPIIASGFQLSSLIPQIEEHNSGDGDVVDRSRTATPEIPVQKTLPPKREMIARSFKHIGEEHSIAIFPADSNSGETESSQKMDPLAVTVTSFYPPGGLQHGKILLPNTQALHPAKDEPLPDAAYWTGTKSMTSVAPTPSKPSRHSAAQNDFPSQERDHSSHAGKQNPPALSGTFSKEGNSSSSVRFTTVANEGFDPFEEPTPARPVFSLPMVLTATTLMIIGLTVYYLVQPVPPDVLHARITATIKEWESSDRNSLALLKKAQDSIRQFLADYPDHPSAEQIRTYQDEVDLSEHERRLERRIQFSALRSLSPVERTYINVLTSSSNDPEQTVDKLRAFIAVFHTIQSSEGTADSHRHASSPVEICVELAKRRLKKLEQNIAEINAEQEQVVRRRLDEAAEWDSKDPARAEGIRRGIIELYQHNRWATELVEEAKRLLEKPPS